MLKKFLGLYILLLFLIPVTVLVSVPKTQIGDIRSKAAVEIKRLYFWPSKANLKTGQIYDLELRLESNSKPQYLDLVFNFDPTVIKVTGPLLGDMYSTYSSKYADNTKGVVGISGKEPNTGTVFEKIKIETLRAGKPNFSINYLNSDDKDLKVELPELTVQ